MSRRFVLNTRGVAHFLRCSEMRDACDKLASQMTDEPEYIHGSQGKTRYHVIVHSNDPADTLRRFYGAANN